MCCWFVDGTFGWLAKGRVLEVFDMQTGTRRAAWCFGPADPDLKTVITAVCQFGSDCRATYLAVATAQHDLNSFKICLFDICKSSVVKAVQLSFMVCINSYFWQEFLLLLKWNHSLIMCLITRKQSVFWFNILSLSLLKIVISISFTYYGVSICVVFWVLVLPVYFERYNAVRFIWFNKRTHHWRN